MVYVHCVLLYMYIMYCCICILCIVVYGYCVLCYVMHNIIIIVLHIFGYCRHYRRSQVLFANTLFKAVCYQPDECQVITGGTDRKIGYWETYDGSQIRELDGSQSGSINGMDVNGSQFVTGSSDKLIKLWRYNEGDMTHIGKQLTSFQLIPEYFQV